LIIPKWKDLGIEAIKDNSDADTLFQTRVPQMDTELALYINSASPDPSVTAIYACENIPTPENSFAGQDNTGWCNQQATDLMHQSDKVADETKRLDLIHQIGKLVRQDAVWLPLYQFPTLVAWHTDKLDGPVGTFTSSPLGGFQNMYAWSVK
jgi:peptide/nickel transport system substrate-binding protein